MRRAAAIASVAALALAAGGCLGGGAGSGGSGPETLTVYVSVPLHGERAAQGRAVVNAAKLALSDAGGRVGGLRIRGVYLDDSRGGGWSLARSGANARRAAEDSTAIGYIGDLDSGATRASLPITNQAQIPQVSPASTAVDLTRLPDVGSGDPEDYRPSGEQTFARVVPDDDVQAAAAAEWARQEGVNPIVVSDGSTYGRGLVRAFQQASPPAGPSAGPVQGVYFGGTAESASRKLSVLAGTTDHAPIFGSDALLDPAFLRSAAPYAGRLRITSPFLDPSLLPAAGQRFVRAYRARFGRPDPVAAYGYESMSLLLAAIRRAGDAGDQRGAVTDELLATSSRHSVLGTYSIDGNGDTTLARVSGYRVSDGLPVFPQALSAGR